jgi:hypothetical protein
MKDKETLEQAAERLYQKGLKDDLSLSFHDGVNFGAKWQAERSYSKEDLEEAFKAGREGDMVFNNESPKYWDFNQWFEQFKKK